MKMFLKGRPVTMFMPKDQVDSYSLEARGELPSNKLKLDWVYPVAAASEFSAEIQAGMKTLAEYLDNIFTSDPGERGILLLNLLARVDPFRLFSPWAVAAP